MCGSELGHWSQTRGSLLLPATPSSYASVSFSVKWEWFHHGMPAGYMGENMQSAYTVSGSEKTLQNGNDGHCGLLSEVGIFNSILE